jgi:hypothetical protein
MTTRGKRTEDQRRFEAEDRAIAYLEKFPPDVALATALMVAFQLAERWSEERRAILRRGENPEVFQISEDDFETLRTARTFLPPNVEIDPSAMVDLRRIFRSLRSDCKWMAANTVACRACQIFLYGQRQKLDDALPELGAAPDAKNSSSGPPGWLL